MYKKIAVVIGTLALVAVLGSLAVGAVSAQTANPQAQATPGSQAAPGSAAGNKGLGLDIDIFGGSTAVFDAEAAALNLTPTQLFEQLHSGKSLSDIATAQGVDLQKVQDAAKAVQTKALQDNIKQAVADGTMTQAQADWLQEGIDKGYLNNGLPGLGFGGRGGFGVRGGPGGHMRGGPGTLPGLDGTAPTAPSTPSTGTTG